MLKFQQFKFGLQSKTDNFNLKHLFSALNMLSALRLTYLTCWAMGD